MNYVRKKLDPPKVLVLGFVAIILLGAYLLSLPVSSSGGEGLPFIKALFTATSATCVTGLVVVDTGTAFSLFGQIVILLLIQIGGLGFMTFATLFAFLLGKRISLKERIILQESLNNLSIEGIVRLAKRILAFTAIIELAGAIILAIRFSFDMPIKKAVFYGIFHSISTFNNAGFDLMGEYRSLTGYVNDPVVVLTVCLLIVIGGIGFIVINELYEYRQTHQLSLHTKVVLSTTLFLLSAGAILLFALEYANGKTLGPLGLGDKFLGALFQSVTARTAGANTISIADMTQSGLFLMIFLMFIGASSGSTGGGIKTTTFAILFGAVKSQVLGKEDVVFFKRRIEYEVIYKALTVTISALTLIFIATMLLTITEKGQDFLVILFETTSAFATVGLSMGLTPKLSPPGEILVMLLMLAGRVGPLTLAYAITAGRKPDPYKYPKGKIMIG